MQTQVSKCYQFGHFRLALDEHRLYSNDSIVLLPPKEFDLLLLLVEHSGQVMERESLIKALWPDTIVEEANLNVHISALRKALAERKEGTHYIETLPRHGYRFTAPVFEVNEPEKKSLVSVANPVAVESAQEKAQTEVLNDHLAIQDRDAGRSNWYSRHRIAAVTLPLWLLAIALIGILCVLFFKPFRSKADRGAESPPLNLVPLTT